MTTSRGGLGDGEVEAQSLDEELAFALTHQALPRMLRCLLETARAQLSPRHAGPCERSLLIARFAVGEWRRWRAEATTFHL